MINFHLFYNIHQIIKNISRNHRWIEFFIDSTLNKIPFKHTYMRKHEFLNLWKVIEFINQFVTVPVPLWRIFNWNLTKFIRWSFYIDISEIISKKYQDNKSFIFNISYIIFAESNTEWVKAASSLPNLIHLHEILIFNEFFYIYLYLVCNTSIFIFFMY